MRGKSLILGVFLLLMGAFSLNAQEQSHQKLMNYMSATRNVEPSFEEKKEAYLGQLQLDLRLSEEQMIKIRSKLRDSKVPDTDAASFYNSWRPQISRILTKVQRTKWAQIQQAPLSRKPALAVEEMRAELKTNTSEAVTTVTPTPTGEGPVNISTGAPVSQTSRRGFGRTNTRHAGYSTSIPRSSSSR